MTSKQVYQAEHHVDQVVMIGEPFTCDKWSYDSVFYSSGACAEALQSVLLEMLEHQLVWFAEAIEHAAHDLSGGTLSLADVFKEHAPMLHEMMQEQGAGNSEARLGFVENELPADFVAKQCMPFLRLNEDRYYEFVPITKSFAMAWSTEVQEY